MSTNNTKPEDKEITPIEKAIAEFERLKSVAPNLRDMLYLDGVLAVLETIKEDSQLPPSDHTAPQESKQEGEDNELDDLDFATVMSCAIFAKHIQDFKDNLKSKGYTITKHK